MKKLALIAAVVVIAVLAVRLWPDRTNEVAPPVSSSVETTAPRQTVSVPPTTPSASTPPGTSGPYGGTDEAKRAWEPIVQGFALAYPDTTGLTRKQWLANLRPYLDRKVLAALATTDLKKVPNGHYAGYQTLKIADEALTVRVTYQEGWALVLYLAADGDGTWSVTSFDASLDFD